MSFLKKGALFIVTIILFFSLLGMLIFSTLSASLSYENIEKNSKNLIENLTGKEILGYNVSKEIDTYISDAQNFCKQYPANRSYTVSYENNTINVSCSTILQGKEAVINETIGDFTSNAYYKSYNCSLINCFSQEKTPLFLISKQSHDYWRNNFFLVLGISLILISIAYFLFENKTNWPVHTGIVLLASLLVFFIALKVAYALISFPYSLALDVLFYKFGTIFWTFLIIGVVILLSGVMIKTTSVRGLVKGLLSHSK